MSTYCREVQERIEKRIEKPIDQWIERRERKCKKRKCKWWCLCCNKWFCWIETFLEKLVKWIVVTVTKWIIRTVCEVVDGLLSFAGVLLGLALAIPLLGRLLHELWDGLIDLAWRLISLPGLLADLVGWEWRKRLRICIVILSNEDGPVASEASLQPAIEAAKRIYDNAANVTLLVEGVHTVLKPAPEGALVTGCGTGAWWDDLWTPGSWFDVTANEVCFEGSGRRLVGWASPVVCFVVQEVEGKLGCSVGPVSDYVTVTGKQPVCLAHEVGHSCGLWHVSEAGNLMNPRCGGTTLKKWQRIILRNSRHVTYF